MCVLESNVEVKTGRFAQRSGRLYHALLHRWKQDGWRHPWLKFVLKSGTFRKSSDLKLLRQWLRCGRGRDVRWNDHVDLADQKGKGVAICFHCNNTWQPQLDITRRRSTTRQRRDMSGFVSFRNIQIHSVTRLCGSNRSTKTRTTEIKYISTYFNNTFSI